MIQLNNIGKVYQQTQIKALDGITLTIGSGELFGLIGPDGAGKTSLFRILATLILPDGGSFKINEEDGVRDFEKIRLYTGYMPGRFSLYMDLTVKENLEFFATVFNTSIAENYDYIRDIYHPLEPFAHRRAAQLSGGMKQKLALACALIHKPKILLLDEPTTGVDPVSRREFWDILEHLKQLGITTVVSTPYMDEALRCDRLALMDQGKILKLGTPETFMQDFGADLFALESGNMYDLLVQVREHPDLVSCFAFGSAHHAAFIPGTMDESRLRIWLAARGLAQAQVRRILPGIEDCFMAYLTRTEAIS